jgi:ribosomal protein L37AE/L43A
MKIPFKEQLMKWFRKLLNRPELCHNCSNIEFYEHFWRDGRKYWVCSKCQYSHVPKQNGGWIVLADRPEKEHFRAANYDND